MSMDKTGTKEIHNNNITRSISLDKDDHTSTTRVKEMENSLNQIGDIQVKSKNENGP